jgi:hypothetical protein
MSGIADVGLANHPRSRAIFIHSRGSRLFLGRTPERNGREVTVEEIEALTSAGFEIVEINMKEGAPLCAALATVPAGEKASDVGTWLPRAASIWLEPRAPSVVGLHEGAWISERTMPGVDQRRTP